VADYLPRQYLMRLKARQLVTSFTDDELREMGCDPDKLREWMSKLHGSPRSGGESRPTEMVIRVENVSNPDAD
jgi:hypothetical protein